MKLLTLIGFLALGSVATAHCGSCAKSKAKTEAECSKCEDKKDCDKEKCDTEKCDKAAKKSDCSKCEKCEDKKA